MSSTKKQTVVKEQADDDLDSLIEKIQDLSIEPNKDKTIDYKLKVRFNSTIHLHVLISL